MPCGTSMRMPSNHRAIASSNLTVTQLWERKEAPRDFPDQSMDAQYLRSVLGQVVAKGCAETIAASPVDPIHHLSLWLLKYVANVNITRDFFEEKDFSLQQQRLREQIQQQREALRAEDAAKRAEAINMLRQVADDPYSFFDACLRTVLEFTGCSSAYVALVLDKLWQPSRKILDSEDENMPNDGENEEVEEEEEEEEEEPEEEEEEEEKEERDETNEEELLEGRDANKANDDPEAQQEGVNVRKVKRKKPINYKKKILLYVATTPNNEFLINKQLDKKLVPVTFSVLLKKLPKLHIPNVLYQEGIHFFEGMPLLGAYLTIPVLLATDPPQVIALLCADTLRKQNAGFGRPFSAAEEEFITTVANVATDVLSSFHKGVPSNSNTKEIIQKLKDEIRQLKNARKAELKRLRRKSVQDNEAGNSTNEDNGAGDTANEDNEAGDTANEDTEAGDTANEDGNDHKKEIEISDVESAEDEDDDSGTDGAENPEDETDETIEEEQDEEDFEAGEEEVQEEDMEQVDQTGDEKQLKETKKMLRQQRKKVKYLQTHFKKSQSLLEKQSSKVVKLEKKVQKLDSALNHLNRLRAKVLDTVVQYKDNEFRRVKQCLFPSATIYRVFKALLFILGQTDAVIHDWTKARQIITENICTAMKEYNAVTDEDLRIWDTSDLYIDGITEEVLLEEAPIGYLCQQWLHFAKKVAFKTIKLNKYKMENEKASKDFADAELEQMVAEIDLRVAMDEEKKLSFQLEELQLKISKELSSNRNDEEEVNEKEVDEDEEE